MLKDKVTGQTYSSGIDAKRVLGVQEFNRKTRRDEFEYIQTYV